MIKLLLIEQEVLFAKAFSKLVENTDCQLIGIVSSFEEAKELCQSGTPDIILSELVIGTESGIEICQKLKNCFPSVKLYLLSNYYTMERLSVSVSIGADEILYKPITKEKLKQIIGNHALILKQEEETYKWIETDFKKKDFALVKVSHQMNTFRISSNTCSKEMVCCMPLEERKSRDST